MLDNVNYKKIKTDILNTTKIVKQGLEEKCRTRKSQNCCKGHHNGTLENNDEIAMWNFGYSANYSIDHHNALEPGCKIGFAQS